jgi:Gpi18-like mannosyltransferase
LSVESHAPESVLPSKKVGRWYFSLSFLFFLGLLIRVAFAPFTEHQFDVGTFKNMGLIAYSLHINPLYYWSYGPVWLYIILAVYPFYLLASLVQPSELLLNFIIKLPLIVGDMVLAFCLYRLSLRVTQNESIAKKVAVAWLFNPLVIFVSSIHGMFDQLPALFTVISLAFLLDRRIKLSAASLAIALSLKLYAVFLVPFLILPIAKENGRKALEFLAIFLGTTLLLYSPYLIDPKTIGILISVYTGYEGFGTFLGHPIGLAAFISYNTLPSSLVFILTNQLLCLFLPALSLLMLYLWKKQQLFSLGFNFTNRNIAVILLTYFLAYQFVHPQFVIWVLPFLLMAYLVSNQLHRYLYHATWLSIFLWYAVPGFPTFISTAIFQTPSWWQTVTARLSGLNSLLDLIFVISSILSIVSMLSWRKQ